MAYRTSHQRMLDMAHEAMAEATDRPAFCPAAGRACVGRECAAALGRVPTLAERLRDRPIVAVWECTAYPTKRRVDEAEEPIGY